MSPVAVDQRAKLGSGTFGTVHQARYGDQPCAAKTFFVSQSELDRKIIDKEITVLQRLRFRHVIQFYRTHEQDGRIYLLMELAEKGSLAHAITERHISHNDWETKARLAHEIARGLAYIHQERVLHRDLKSANVLLTKHMEVKLADFGLAQTRLMASTASSTGDKGPKSAVGTLRWVAPELLYADKPSYSTKSDVYALGVVMWEMAADCTRPFKEQQNEALVALDVKRGRREQLPEDTPIEYRTWVERCWAQNPCDRPNASNVILEHDQSTVENSDTVGIFLDLDSGGSELVHSPEACNPSNQEVDRQHMLPENHNDYVGSLPQTDDDVVSYFCKAAKEDNTDAQLFLAWIYDHGRGVGKSERNSFWWCRQAAKGGNVVAQLRLARMYEHGQGVGASNAFKATTWYHIAAAGGSVEAQLALGRMYADGYGVKEDTFQAARCTLYEQDEDTNQNLQLAVKWFTKAAEQGDVYAQNIIGVMYAYGLGVDQNDEEAVKWYLKAAEHGDTNAQNNLGQMYADGQGVDQSDDEAVKWFTKAAEQGNAYGQYNLGSMYTHGRGVDQSDDEAVKLYIKAAEQGNAHAQNNLGSMYTHGRGVGQSDDEAVKLYIKAAEQGHAYARNNLGSMYIHGRGVDQSDDEAVKLYIKAAEHGVADAQLNLGLMYADGRGVDQSDEEAVKWVTKAAEQGYANAQSILGQMYADGRGVDQSDDEAVK
ncbi:copper transport protein ctr1, partial [Actinomortierella ambigua]